MAETVKLQLRLPVDVHRAVADLAEREDRSINGQIVYLLRQALAAPPRSS